MLVPLPSHFCIHIKKRLLRRGEAPLGTPQSDVSKEQLRMNVGLLKYAHKRIQAMIWQGILLL